MGRNLRAFAHTVPIGVDRISRDCRSLVVETFGDRKEVARRQNHIVGIATINMNPDIAAMVFTQGLASAMAPAAVATIEIKIDRAPITGSDIGHPVPNRDNIAAEFMPHDPGRFASEYAGSHGDKG